MITIGVDCSELDAFIGKLTSGYGIDKYLKKMTEDLSAELLKLIKQRTPIGETSALVTGWNTAIQVKRLANGYEATLLNNCEYASAVNDGHMVKNQFGGPYQVHSRVKVLTPKQWQLDKSNWYVFGHFFVEEGIVDVEAKILDIVSPQLENWIRWCLSG